MDRFAEVSAQIIEQNTWHHESPSGGSSIDLAKFQNLLASAEGLDDEVLVNPTHPQSTGMTGALDVAVAKFSAANQSYKGALEDSVKTLGALDPASPRASIVMLETAINMSINEAHMKFASKIAGSSKEALNTLLRSQG
jgi:hypothetical protein